MNLVSLALRRPISLLTMVVAVALVGFLAVDRMSRDIFPDLGVPTIYVAQPYGGLDPAQMEGFIVNYYEYHFLYITGIEHVESKSIQGVALIKLQFHPGTDMAQALAETVSYVDRARAFMPTGTVPPFVSGSMQVACRSATSSSPARRKQSPSFRTRRSSRCAHCSPPCQACRHRRPSVPASVPSSFAWIPTSCDPTTCRRTRWCGRWPPATRSAP